MRFAAGNKATELDAKRPVKRTARHKRIDKALFMSDPSFILKRDGRNHTTIAKASLSANERPSDNLPSSLSAIHLLFLGHGF
jgi:hypothetical protein